MQNSQLFIFVYLLLAHLLADFVFQPRALVEWKHKSWKGVFVHSLVVLVMSMICLGPFVIAGDLWIIPVLIVNAVLHFLMDGYKIGKEQQCEVCTGGGGERHRCYVRWFLLDQFFHVAVLVLAAFAILRLPTGEDFFWESYWLPAIYLVAAIAVTYVWEIVKFQFTRQKSGAMVMQFRVKEMVLRWLVFTSIVILIPVLFFGLLFGMLWASGGNMP